MTAMLSLCVFLFVLGWGKFSLDQPWIYFADYSLRLLLIGLALKALPGELRTLNLPRLNIWGMAFLACCILLIFNGLYSDTQTLKDINGYFLETVSFPMPESPWLLRFDFIGGLLLVAMSEELVFRSMFVSLAEKLKWSNVKLYVISSVVFGLIHLPQGLVNVFDGMLWGVLLMFFYKRTRSIWFVVTLHYLADVWFFGLDWLWA